MEFPEDTLFCPDAGFTGYELWDAMLQAGPLPLVINRNAARRRRYSLDQEYRFILFSRNVSYCECFRPQAFPPSSEMRT
jgi:hypothetical protein